MPRKNSKRRKKKRKKVILDTTTTQSKPEPFKKLPKLWAIAFMLMVVISIATRVYLNNTQSKTPPGRQHIHQLENAIRDLHSDQVEALVARYNYDLNEPNAYPQFKPLMDQFFLQWIQQIHDNQYNTRLKVLKLLVRHTNVHDQTELCICNQAIQYRLIDAMSLILPSMSLPSITQCFSHKTQTANNTIFHMAAKSKSASLARLILKLGYDNPKLQLAAQRLHIKLPKTHSDKPIVFQNDIKQMQSQEDVEMVVRYAQGARMDTEWFHATNSENFTGFDYWLLMNHRKQTQSTLLTEYLNQQTIRTVEQSVKKEHCDFDKE
eukprot:374357_1